MKHKNCIKRIAIIGLIILACITFLIRSKKTFNPQSSENINALTTQTDSIEEIHCLGEGDLLCPSSNIKVKEIYTLPTLNEQLTNPID